MLMKHTKVLADGSVKEPPLAQLTYGALIQGRVQMVMGACVPFLPLFSLFFSFSGVPRLAIDSANVSKLALTIAIRYGTVRRQFSHKEGEPEKQIINYASHQFRLMPLLALSYAMHFGGVS